MFYQVRIGVTGITSWFETNLPRDQVLERWLCPFLAKEPTLIGDVLYNMSTFGSLKVFRTEKVIDSDWPVSKKELSNKSPELQQYEYSVELQRQLSAQADDVTAEMTREALVLLESGKWKDRVRLSLEKDKGKFCFFICPFENEEVNHNYKFVIGPVVRQHGFDIKRVDEVSHTKTITEIILASIARARFIVADLTDTRPNCYYELGYAHALGKPVILLAKEGTERHFDISTYQWNYWRSYEDLQPLFEQSVSAVLADLGLLQSGVHGAAQLRRSANKI
jgi:hypothetical protein